MFLGGAILTIPLANAGSYFALVSLLIMALGYRMITDYAFGRTDE